MVVVWKSPLELKDRMPSEDLELMIQVIPIVLGFGIFFGIVSFITIRKMTTIEV